MRPDDRRAGERQPAPRQADHPVGGELDGRAGGSEAPERPDPDHVPQGRLTALPRAGRGPLPRQNLRRVRHRARGHGDRPPEPAQRSRSARPQDRPEAAGVPEVRLDPLAPVVYADLTRQEISQLSKITEVVTLFRSQADGIDDLDDSIKIANSDNVHSQGKKGSGVKVAVWEEDL